MMKDEVRSKKGLGIRGEVAGFRCQVSGVRFQVSGEKKGPPFGGRAVCDLGVGSDK